MMLNHTRMPSAADLANLDVLLREQKRLLDLAAYYLETTQQSAHEIQTARLKFDVLHGIGYQLVLRRNETRQKYLSELPGLDTHSLKTSVQ